MVRRRYFYEAFVYRANTILSKVYFSAYSTNMQILSYMLTLWTRSISTLWSNKRGVFNGEADFKMSSLSSRWI